MAVHHPGLQMEIGDLQAMIRRMVVQTFQNAAIGSAGMRVYDGGWITIENGGLNISGQALISGLLDVTGRLEGAGVLDWTGTVYFRGPTDFIGDVDITGATRLRGVTTLESELSLLDDVILAAGGKIVAGNATLESQMSAFYFDGGQVRFNGGATINRSFFLGTGFETATSTSEITHWLGVTASGQVKKVPKSMGGPQGSGDFAWPFSLSTVTDEYGPRPLGDGFHNGIDFGVPEGTPIPAPAGGTVLAKGYDAIDRGYWIALDHGDRGAGQLVTRYFHMQAASPLAVDASVAKGASIGLVGNTGFSTGPHLHWETWVNGADINPRSFMAIYG